MTSESSKRRDFLSQVFISQSISKKLLIKTILVVDSNEKTDQFRLDKKLSVIFQ